VEEPEGVSLEDVVVELVGLGVGVGSGFFSQAEKVRIKPSMNVHKIAFFIEIPHFIKFA
jgi:hypothetical protein